MSVLGVFCPEGGLCVEGVSVRRGLCQVVGSLSRGNLCLERVSVQKGSLSGGGLFPKGGFLWTETPCEQND